MIDLYFRCINLDGRVFVVNWWEANIVFIPATAVFGVKRICCPMLRHATMLEF